MQGFRLANEKRPNDHLRSLGLHASASLTLPHPALPHPALPHLAMPNRAWPDLASKGDRATWLQRSQCRSCAEVI